MVTGIPAVVDMAHRMGITCLGLPCDDGRDVSTYGISLTLGGYEVRLADMATAVSTLATMGVRHREAPILSIQDGLGRKLWTYSRGASTDALVLRHPGVILAVGDTLVVGQAGRLAGLNPLTGAPRWEAPIAVPPRSHRRRAIRPLQRLQPNFGLQFFVSSSSTHRPRCHYQFHVIRFLNGRRRHSR